MDSDVEFLLTLFISLIPMWTFLMLFVIMDDD